MVHQEVEMAEVFSGVEIENKYAIKTPSGELLFNAVEASSGCIRQYFGPYRSFKMKILDLEGQEVMHLKRPLACTLFCFPCCLQRLEVGCPPGNVIGTVEQQWSVLRPRFFIRDASRNVVFRIEGPLLTFGFCTDVEFKVFSADGMTELGKISRRWGGIYREVLTDADIFGICFPDSVDPKLKAVLLRLHVLRKGLQHGAIVTNP